MSESVAVCRRRINYKMLERLEHPSAERLFKILHKCSLSGWNDPPVRWLAAQIRRSMKQTQRGLAKLEAAGFILHRRRWISRTRCATSVYKIVGCFVVVADVPEKPKAVNTTTPPCRRWDNHPPAMQKMHDRIGVLYAQLRGERALRRKDELPAQPKAYTGMIPDDEIERMGGDAVIRLK